MQFISCAFTPISIKSISFDIDVSFNFIIEQCTIFWINDLQNDTLIVFYGFISSANNCGENSARRMSLST